MNTWSRPPLGRAAVATVLLLGMMVTVRAQADGQAAGGPRFEPRLWVYSGDRLELVSPQGRTVFSTTSVFGRGLQANIGFRTMATDGSDGGLWFADANSDRLFKLSPTGSEILEVDVVGPRGIAVDSRDGSVWTSTYDSASNTRDVVKFSRDGHELVRIGGFSGAVSSISLDERNGNLWVADYDADEVVRLSGSDAQLNGYDASAASGPRHVRVSGFNEPASVSANPHDDGDGAGNGWVANRIPGEAVKLSPTGAELVTAVPSTGSEARLIEADRLRGEAWALIVNGNEGMARFSATGEELRFVRLFTAVANTLTLKRYELPRTFDLDPYRGVVWVGLWVFRRGFDTTGAVVALDRSGHGWQRFSARGPVWDIAVQSRQLRISVDGTCDSARRRDRVFTVAVLSGQTFDPLQVDVRSVRFGPGGATARGYDAKDVNGDGIADLVLRFDAKRTGLSCDDHAAGLTASTYDGMALEGSDDISAGSLTAR